MNKLREQPTLDDLREVETKVMGDLLKVYKWIMGEQFTMDNLNEFIDIVGIKAVRGIVFDQRDYQGLGEPTEGSAREGTRDVIENILYFSAKQIETRRHP